MEQERGISVSTAALQFEYKDCILNLLDTPGHEDFSEDTYRTLMAVDCAIMLLDAAKGVEPQTIKLFRVCRERNIPIVTLINKMDQWAKEPFALLDEVEKVLGLSSSPIVWPMGSGQDFKGVYDLGSKTVHQFERTAGGAFKAPSTVAKMEDLRQYMDEQLFDSFQEGVELAQGALPEFSQEAFLAGEITPVFFASAVTNFGIQLFLDRFLELCPTPRPVVLADDTKLEPTINQFSGFVFKLQANMNRNHRDRVAFIRITSGVFERGMAVFVPRMEKQVKLSSPVAFFGQERSTIDVAYPGDIIGIINPGLYQIGDIFCTGEPPNFKPLPRFAPDMFARLVPLDTDKQKQFRKGLQELSEEGVVQIFQARDGYPIIGAVGQLQFEVFRFRLEDEYGAPCRLEVLGFECSRWIQKDDENKFTTYDLVVKDQEGRSIVLFKSEYRMKSFQSQNPNVILFDHAPEAS